MTNHDMLAEGSHKTYRDIVRQMEMERLAKRERKALKRTPAGVEWVTLQTSTLTERLLFESRGWELEEAVSVGIASVTRFVMKIRREELSERL